MGSSTLIRRTIFKQKLLFIKIFLIIIFVLFIAIHSNEDSKLSSSSFLQPAAQSKLIAELELPKSPKGGVPQTNVVTAVLVMCSKRGLALRNHLQELLKQRPNSEFFHIVISQDGNYTEVENVAKYFVDKYSNVTYMNHPQIPIKRRNYYPAIAAHYKWALNKVFFERNYQYVVVTEDDLDVGVDFFSYFGWARRMLDEDKTVWCVSAWNDNGRTNTIDQSQTQKLWRTDFFPGLGWMLTKSLWMELSPNFPTVYWDDWMRTPNVRKNRSCIRPEVSRTSHNMKLAGKGSSGAMYKDFLMSIKASSVNVDFSLIPTISLKKDEYDTNLIETLKEAKSITMSELKDPQKTIDSQYTYKISYSNVREWYNIANFFKIMKDIRGGITRTAYYGIVPVMHNNTRYYIVPKIINDYPENMTKYEYDQDWDKMARFIDFQRIFCRPGKFDGKCDPKSPQLINYFKRRGWSQKLKDWGEMIVN